MAKKKKNQSTDVNVTAFQILEAITHSPRIIDVDPKAAEKNPAAVALGRLGGLKGGRARAKKLTKKRRAEIALKAAKARWKHPE
jgi:hypothetical protein